MLQAAGSTLFASENNKSLNYYPYVTVSTSFAVDQYTSSKELNYFI